LRKTVTAGLFAHSFHDRVGFYPERKKRTAILAGKEWETLGRAVQQGGKARLFPGIPAADGWQKISGKFLFGPLFPARWTTRFEGIHQPRDSASHNRSGGRVEPA